MHITAEEKASLVGKVDEVHMQDESVDMRMCDALYNIWTERSSDA
jgi:hypothetical protein